VATVYDNLNGVIHKNDFDILTSSDLDLDLDWSLDYSNYSIKFHKVLNSTFCNPVNRQTDR